MSAPQTYVLLHNVQIPLEPRDVMRDPDGQRLPSYPSGLTSVALGTLS